ncbi:GNAT family N-acetyltransferase [Marinimicrobium sp. ABcell2]|uniref:GNAT family N-acetyltransferase n=1 Tax=Marinimicrobium sp. ABcell2 TaxID=3069751 RepID=UPI0027B50718|nr:GNAT family N-acetyltransferase [Marinimicrobium sp. ABcell2]MDQ2075205.1 GNAT family N-acetyltransferase [Marinimicrobium sp. ABcell2]
MEVIEDFAEKHVLQVHALYQREWWTKGRTVEQTRNCISGSQICIGVLASDGNVIGFTRVLTDFTFKAIIFDVIVEESHRGHGIGERLISLVKSHKKLRSVTHFELYGLPELIPFYKKHGFTTEVGGIALMRCENA